MILTQSLFPSINSQRDMTISFSAFLIDYVEYIKA